MHGLGDLLSYFSHTDANLRLVRRTWWAGFCGLPLLWLLNWLNFRKLAHDPDAPAELKILTRASLILFSIVLAAFIAWLAFFQTVADTMPCSCDGIFGTDSGCDFASVPPSRCRQTFHSARTYVIARSRCTVTLCDSLIYLLPLRSLFWPRSLNSCYCTMGDSRCNLVFSCLASCLGLTVGNTMCFLSECPAADCSYNHVVLSASAHKTQNLLCHPHPCPCRRPFPEMSTCVSPEGSCQSADAA